MGRNIEDIRRLRERLSTGQLPSDQALMERLALKSRIIGILLEDARRSSGHSVADTAAMLGITEDQYRAFETGDDTPTLPQLEVLAYTLKVPIKHFWGGATLAEERQEDEIRERMPEVLELRQLIIGVQLNTLREQAGLTLEQLAEQTGMAVEDLEAVELGEASFPVNELEVVAQALHARLDDLIDSHGPIGTWLQAQEDFETFASLPADLRAFILKPLNRSYLDLAVRLSELETSRLRSIAESILEITL